MPRVIPLLWALLHVVKAALSVWGGVKSDRWGRRVVIGAGWLVYALVYAGFAVSTSIGGAGRRGSCSTAFYYGLSEGTEKALIADLAPASLRGHRLWPLQRGPRRRLAAGERRLRPRVEAREPRRRVRPWRLRWRCWPRRCSRPRRPPLMPRGAGLDRGAPPRLSRPGIIRSSDDSHSRHQRRRRPLEGDSRAGRGAAPRSAR